MYIRHCLFTITMFCFENEAVKKNFSCLALHSVVQNKMLQHSYTTTKKLVVTNSSPESTLWLLRGLHMSDVTGLYVNAKHASCHNTTCELIADSPFYFHHSEGRAWKQGYPLPSLYNVELSKVHFVCTALSNSLLNLTKTLFWNKNSVQIQYCYRHILNYL